MNTCSSTCLSWETKDSDTLLNPTKLASPFSYRLKVHANGEKIERRVDLPETFNYLLGLKVQKREVFADKEHHYPRIPRRNARCARSQGRGHMARDRGLDGE